MKTPFTLLVLALLPLATAVQYRLNPPLMRVAAQTRPKPPVTAPPPSSALLAPPPIKMGLWKTTTTSAIAGLQIPPEVAAKMQAMGRSFGQPQTVNTLSCITPEKWKQIFNHQRDQNCQLSNQQQSSSGMSADITCTSSRGPETTGHIDMTFDSDSQMHGKMHMTVNTQSQPQPMNIDTTMQSTYQGADCQGVSPDSPKVVH